LMAELTGGYPGGHWVRYDPATDVTEDLGIAVPGESLLGFAIDPRTHRLYATTHTNSLLVEYDIAAGRSEVVGSVGGFPTRVMECTAESMVYTFDDEGRVIRFDPRSRELRTLDARLPGWEGDVNFLTSFATVLGVDGHTIYGVTTAFVWEPRDPLAPVIKGRRREFRPGYAFAYDTQAGPDGRMRIIGPSGCDPAVPMSDVHLHHSIAMTRAGDLLYVSARAQRPAHLVMIDVTGSSGGGGSPGNEKLVDLGELVGEGDEGYVETALAATTGADGTVYFGGPRKSEKYERDDMRWALIILADGSWL